MKSFLPSTFFIVIGVVASVSCWPTASQSEIFTRNITALSSFQEDLLITAQQKRILDKFRKRVGHRLTHEYMKTDLYLVRWLRARDFNIRNAEEMLMASLAWRRENKMDGIQKEDWSIFTSNYPYYLNIYDKEGKPMLYCHPAQWDLRSVALSDQAKRLQRYIDKAIDESWLTVLEKQTKYQNVTQGVLIVNLEGYNVVQHACLQCIPIILRGILTYEKYYPGLAHRIFLLNTPAAFEPLLQTIKTVLSPPTEKALRIYGMSKAEWKPVLLKYIDKDQLPEELGGTFQTDKDD